jgi:drug/metabolite transporter (DMT)-like permease
VRGVRGAYGKGLLAVIVWGASFVATRIALESFSAFGLVAARSWAGGLVLAGMLGLVGVRLRVAQRDWPRAVFLGVVLAVHLLLQAHGLRYTSAINTGWIIGFIPVTIAIGSHALGQQRLRPLGWLGVAVGTAGVLAVTLRAPPNFALAHWGDLLQIASCFTWTIYTLACGPLMQRTGALGLATVTMALAALLVSPAAVYAGWQSGPWTSGAAAALAFLGLVCSGIAYYLWFAAQRVLGPARLGVLLYLEPFSTLATGVVLVREPVTLNALLGGLGVLLGVWLVARGTAHVAS